MKSVFEVDTAHSAQTGIALGASTLIVLVAALAYDRVIAISATVAIAVIAIAAIKEQQRTKKERSSTNNQNN